jgi:anti-anti-sigma factor
MKIKESIHQKVAVLAINGTLMGPPHTNELVENLEHLIENGIFRIVIDFKHVKWINSLGVGSIMRCRSIVERAEGWLHLSGLTDKVRSVFVMAQLTKVFEIHDSSDEAVEALNQV